MADPLARLAFAHLKADSLRGLSIGFDALRETPQRDGTRLLHELRLHEISLVSLPMNERAMVTAVKALDDIVPLLASLTPIELHDDATLLQLRSIDHQLKLLLPRDRAEENAELLAAFRTIDEQLKQLLA